MHTLKPMAAAISSNAIKQIFKIATGSRFSLVHISGRLCVTCGYALLSRDIPVTAEQ